MERPPRCSRSCRPRPWVWPHRDPVGRPVAGPPVVLGVDEGLEQPGAVPVGADPVLGQVPDRERQDVRGQVGYLDPGHDQEARLADHLVEVGPPRGLAPANPGVAGRQAPGRGAERHPAQPAALAAEEVALLGSDQRSAAQRVVAGEEVIPPGRPRRSTADPHQLDGAEVRQPAPDRVRARSCRLTQAMNRTAHTSVRSRQRHQASPLQLDQRLAGPDLAEPIRRRPPIEPLAQPARQLTARTARLGLNPATKPIQDLRTERAAVHDHARHELDSARNRAPCPAAICGTCSAFRAPPSARQTHPCVHVASPARQAPGALPPSRPHARPVR